MEEIIKKNQLCKNEIDKLKRELSCHKYCYKYNDIILLGGNIIFVFTISIYVLMQIIMKICAMCLS